MEQLKVTQLEAEQIVATESFDTQDLKISGVSIVDDIRNAARNVVEVTPELESGTKIATVRLINGETTDLYAPEGGGSGGGVEEYSSWQVYATNEDIPAGTVSPYPIEIPCELDVDAQGNQISIQGYESTSSTSAGKAYRAYDPSTQEMKVVIATQSSKMKIPFVT